MTDFDNQQDGRSQTQQGRALVQSKPFLASFLALGEHEWRMAMSASRIHHDLLFQATALILCPLWFGVTVFNVAVNLFEFSWLNALGMLLVAAFGLWVIDSHYLIQTRGIEGGLGGILKVRLATLVLLAISSMLMATFSFKDDIDRVLNEERAVQRAELEQSPQFRLAPLREEVGHAEEAAVRVTELRLAIGQLELDRTQALESMRNECEGNTTDGRARARGCGARARGYEAAAERLSKQIAVLVTQQAQAETLAKTLPKAQAKLANVEKSIDEAAVSSTGGPTKRLAVLVGLMIAAPWNFLIVVWWVALGTILDLPIWMAQGRAFNRKDYVAARKLDQQALDLKLAQWQAQLREQQAAALPEIEVGLGVPLHDAQGVRSATTASSGKPPLLTVVNDA